MMYIFWSRWSRFGNVTSDVAQRLRQRHVATLGDDAQAAL